MVLSTHAIAGSTIAVILRKNPILAMILAFCSHFLLDAVPHWHYKLASLVKDNKMPLGKRMIFDKSFQRDIFATGFDFLIGLVISTIPVAILSPQYIYISILGAFAGVLPDILQLIFYIYPKILFGLQKFHTEIHSKILLDDLPLVGISSQIAISVLFIFFSIANLLLNK